MLHPPAGMKEQAPVQVDREWLGTGNVWPEKFAGYLLTAECWLRQRTVTWPSMQGRYRSRWEACAGWGRLGTCTPTWTRTDEPPLQPPAEPSAFPLPGPRPATQLPRRAPDCADLPSATSLPTQSDPRSGRNNHQVGTIGDVLALPSPGVVLVSRAYYGNGDANEQDLRASFDGGRHWAVVYRGQLFYLGFTSPAQGVGLVQSSKATTSLIMTFDGGHHWASVAL